MYVKIFMGISDKSLARSFSNKPLDINAVGLQTYNEV